MNRTARQRKRLQMLIDETGTQAKLATKVGTADAYISQLLNLRDGVARKFCEKLEKATGKPDGWMDQWLPEECSEAPTPTAKKPARKTTADVICEKVYKLDPSVQQHLLMLIETIIALSDPRGINHEATAHRQAMAVHEKRARAARGK